MHSSNSLRFFLFFMVNVVYLIHPSDMCDGVFINVLVVQLTSMLLYGIRTFCS